MKNVYVNLHFNLCAVLRGRLTPDFCENIILRYELAMMVDIRCIPLFAREYTTYINLDGQDMYQQLKSSFESLGRSFPMRGPGAKIGPIDQNIKQNFELGLQHFYWPKRQKSLRRQIFLKPKSKLRSLK